jgi:dienelactone hydrolase
MSKWKAAKLDNMKKVALATGGILGNGASEKISSGSHSVEQSQTTLKIPKSVLKTDDELAIEIYSPMGAPGNKPCIVFSHGWETSPKAYESLLKELASHGYMVVSVGHPSSSQPYSGLIDSEKEFFEDKTSIQANNLGFVIDWIQKGERNPSKQIVLAGHSMGGAASVLASQNHPQIAGCINLDGSLKGESGVRTKGLEIPFLMVLADHLKDAVPSEEFEAFSAWKTKEYDLMIQDWEKLIQNSPKSRKMQITGIGHMDFAVASDKAFSEGNLKALQCTSKEMLKFLGSISS